MGRKRYSSPRRGSLAYSPRVRAKKWIGKIRSWPEFEGPPTSLAFIGFKAGMTHLISLDNKKGSMTYGKEIAVPVTVIETPPAKVCAIKFYTERHGILKCINEVWMKNPRKDLLNISKDKEGGDPEKRLEEIGGALEQIREIKLLMVTQPKLAKLGRKKPELIEVKIGGGGIQEQFDYAKNLLGKDVKASDILKEGQWIDVIGVTKGKGVQGPVKRMGVKRLPHKTRKGRRKVGSIGPWNPAFVMRTIPRAGQMGFHQRTEYNKHLLKIGDDGADVNPKGGFVKYGHINTSYVVVKGSIPGPPKRSVTLRYSMRPPSPSETTLTIQSISLESK